MRNRLIINVLLALIVIALGLTVWLKPGQKIDDKTNITQLDIEAINHIHIERKNAEAIELQLIENQWRLTQPIKALALAGKIERLLKMSQITPPSTYPLDTASNERFGLSAPMAILTFNKTTLTIGKTESVHSRRYVSNNKHLFLLDDTFLHHLTAPVNAFIDTRLLPDNIQITGLKATSIHLIQNDDNTWQNTFKPSAELSSDAVQMLLDEWRFARAIKVSHSSNQATTSTIVISFSNHPTMTFNLFEQKDRVMLISTDTQIGYTLSREKYQKMISLPTLQDDDA